MNWLALHIGAKAARVVGFLITCVLVLLVLFVAVRCTGRDERQQATAQAMSDRDTAEAIQNAAASAVETIENRSVTEKDIDHAAAVATLQVEQSADADAVRAAVLAGVCGSASHRHDPACRVR